MTVAELTMSRLRVGVGYRVDVLMILGVVALGGVLRFLDLGSQSYWGDETATLIISTAPGPGALLVSALGYDTHPPLFHLLLQGWIALGMHEWVTRALPAVLGVAAVPAIYWLGRSLVDSTTGLVAALLLAVSPFHVAYSQELRMYALVALLSIASVGCYFSWTRNPRWLTWLCFVLASGLALYTEYMAGLILVALALHFLVTNRSWRRAGPWAASQLVLLALALPVAAIFLIQASRVTGQFWAPKVQLAALGGTLQLLSVGHSLAPGLLPLAFLFGIPVLIGLSRALRHPSVVLLLGLCAFLPILLLYVVSTLREPVYVERALIVSLPAFLVLVGMGVTQLKPLPLAAALLAGLAILNGASLVSYFGDPRFGKPDVRDAQSYVASIRGPRDVVVASSMLADTLRIYHRVAGQTPPDLYMLAYPAALRAWQEYRASMDEAQLVAATDTRASLMRATPYGAWRSSAYEHMLRDMNTEVVDADGLRQMALASERVVYIHLTEEGWRQIAQPLFSTRTTPLEQWAFPIEARLDPADTLAGFRLTETRGFEGIAVDVYDRS